VCLRLFFAHLYALVILGKQSTPAREAEGSSKRIAEKGKTRFTPRGAEQERLMPINYDELMQAKETGIEAGYTERDTMLYALGIGFMRDPMNMSELPFVYENGLKTVPTMAAIIGWGKSSVLARSGINYLMVVDGERRVTLHKPLPTDANVLMDQRILGVFDKGKDKGAVIVSETVIREKASGDKLCTQRARLTSRMRVIRGRIRRSSMRCPATAIRCIATQTWQRWRAFRAPFCMASVPTARRAAR
jgi:hypothetical protein